MLQNCSWYLYEIDMQRKWWKMKVYVADQMEGEEQTSIKSYDWRKVLL